MRVSHSLDRVGVTFDDERLVANAGLIAPAALAERLGLKALFDERVDLGDAPGAANAGLKAMTVIHAVLAGADSIDDCDVLRAGSTAVVLGHEVRAPSTIGTFLRSFSWPHAGQIDVVAAEMLRRAWAGGGTPGDLVGSFTIDMDSSIHETYGTKKHGGGRFGYTKVRGYHPLYAIAGDGQVVASRLRGGNSHTGRGAPQFLTGAFRQVRAAGVTGPLAMRADSGFYSKAVVQSCRSAGAGWSVTAKMYPNVHAAISTIPDDAWQPIPYWIEDGAEVAAIDWHAFKTRTDPGIACRLVVRRVRPTPGSQLALLTNWSYHSFITDRPGDPIALDSWHRAHANVENAIRDLKYGVGLNHLPSGHFGANAAWLALNVIAHNLARQTARIGGIDIVERPTIPPAGHNTAVPPAPPRQPRQRRCPGERKNYLATDTLRRRYLAIPGRLAYSARRFTLHLPARWPWAEQFNSMLQAIRAVKLVT